MVIKFKGNFRGNIIRSMMVLVLVVILLTTAVYTIGIRLGFRQSAQEALGNQAQRYSRTIMAMLDGRDLNLFNFADQVSPDFRIAARVVQGKMIIVNQQDRVVFHNLPGMTLPRVNERLDALIASEDYYVASAPLGAGQDQLGRVYILAEAAELTYLNTVATRAAIFAGLVGLIMALALSYLLSRRLSRPLSRVVSHMKTLSPVQVEGDYELQVLGDAYNQLLKKVKEQSDLERSFFQNASHELKTPIMTIKGYIEAMADGVFPRTEASYDIIAREIDRLHDAINQLLQLSKASIHGDHSQLELMDLTERIRHMAQSFKTHKEIKVVGGEVFCELDPVAIEKIIGNLITNGIRYSKNLLVFELSPMDEEIVLKVYDDGPGIPGEIRDRVFDRFVKGSDGHTGLGLSIVKTYVTAMGGTIKLCDGDYQGACFLIKLPKKRGCNISPDENDYKL